MSKIDEFKVELNRIKEIYFSAQETFKINEELYNVENKSSYEIYLKKSNTFFHFCKVYFWRSTVLELSKLFSRRKNEDFSIIKLIKKLESDGYFKELEFDKKFLSQISDRIKNVQPLIENLFEQRDKVYAHEDRNNNDVRNNVTNAEIGEILKIAEELIRKLYQVGYGISLEVDIINSPKISLENIISNLSEYDALKREDESGLNV